MATKAGKRGRKRPGKENLSSGTQKDARSEPPLSRERIVSAAIALLDAHGLNGLTMRRLAESLGCGVMSLYWHVENKERVLDLALDAVLEYRQRPDAGGAGHWRTEVVRMLEDWRASMLRHPWSASVLPRQALGPNILARLDLLNRTLSKAGVAEADMNVAIWSLWNYVMGATITRASFDLSRDERSAAQQQLDGMSGSGPTGEQSGLILEDDWDGVFRKGVGFLLDGLAPGR